MKNDDRRAAALKAAQIIVLFCVAGLQLHALHIFSKYPYAGTPMEQVRMLIVASFVLVVMFAGIFLSYEHYNVITKNRAYTDVTGIHNKTACREKLEELDRRQDTYNVGVMMFDLNDLKKVNDNLGHKDGDRLIAAFADMLVEAAGPYGAFAARVGGDEFMIINEHATEESLQQLLQKLEALACDYNRKNELKISYAHGYGISTKEHYYVMDELTRLADRRMYENKRLYKSKRR